MSFLADAFISVLNMSITASYAALAVMIARLLLKKTPKVFAYLLWIVVLFRLICPFSFSTAFSLFGLVWPLQTGTSSTQYISQDIGKMAAPAIDTGVDSMNATFNASLPAATPFASANPMQVWIALGALLWLTGIAVLLIYAVFSYLRLHKQISMATLVSDNIYETDLIRSPFVCGFFKPRIYLPLSLSGVEREYILRHEQIHIKRLDYLVKPAAFLALALHWFNPLIWWCFSLMTKDMEMSCDEQVLQRQAGGEAASYSSSLLALAANMKMPRPSPLAFGESNVKERITNILKYHKPAFWVVIASIMAVISLAAVLMANPIEGLSIYEHPGILGQNSLRAPAKVLIVDHISGKTYTFTEANEIAKVTAIVEDLQIAQKEISKSRSEMPDGRYAISYFADINADVSDYRYTVHVAPVWIDNRVKPSFRYKLLNQKDIFKRIAEVIAGKKDGSSMYDIDALMKNKTQYVGNNSKVVALINTLPNPAGVTRGTIELATLKAPYGVTVSYTQDDDSAQISEEQFLRNSVVLFALIDNVNQITHMGFWNNKLLSSFPFRYTYTRSDAERIAGGDVRNFGKNPESLTELIKTIQLLGADNKKIAIKGLELYVWRKPELTGNNNIYYTLLLGTNRNKTAAEVYDLSVATTNIEFINHDIAKYGETQIFVNHPTDVSKEEMVHIVDQIKVKNGTIAVGAGWFNQDTFRPEFIIPAT